MSWTSVLEGSTGRARWWWRSNGRDDVKKRHRWLREVSSCVKKVLDVGACDWFKDECLARWCHGSDVRDTEKRHWWIPCLLEYDLPEVLSFWIAASQWTLKNCSEVKLISSGVVYFIGQIILWKTLRAEHTSKKTSRKRQQKRTIVIRKHRWSLLITPFMNQSRPKLISKAKSSNVFIKRNAECTCHQ